MIVKSYIKDFENLGFGMFVHFGLYSMLGMAEWVKCLHQISDATYEKLVEQFEPREDWAVKLVKAAKQAGCKYITLTTRHHDGFPLFDTCGLNEYDSLHSKCQRDLVREFVDACNAAGIIPFFYHTLLDWWHKDFQSNFPDYLEYLRASVEILCKNYGKPDAVTGTAALLVYAAKKYLDIEENQDCLEIVRKLTSYLEANCEFKQTRAFQILAGRNQDGDKEFLEQGGAKGYSTFMAYYILKADAMANGQAMLAIMKEYFGAMLSRGATTFWEDFHMEWLEGSGRIDEFPKEGEQDIHGDYGAFCYEGFRHSLCHGWACGVLAFIYEYMLGLKLSDGGATYEVSPNPLGVQEIHARIPTRAGWLEIDVVDGKVNSKELFI